MDLVVEAFGELPDPKQASLAMRTAIEARLGPNIRATVWRKSVLRIVLPGNTGRMREAMDELVRAFLIDLAAASPK